MSKARKSRRQPEILFRSIEIASFSARVRLRAEHPRGEEPYVDSGPWLELRGKATEPVRDVVEVTLSMYPRDEVTISTARPASIGALVRARPRLEFVLTWPQRGFDRVWALALSKNLNYAYLFFTPPRYNGALVVNASFSNELEE